MNNQNMTIHQDFMKNVKEDGSCWIWIMPILNGQSYPIFNSDGLKGIAHEVSYGLFIGERVKNSSISLLCRNRFCVNPLHMKLTIHEIKEMTKEQKIRSKLSKGNNYLFEKLKKEPVVNELLLG